MGYPAEHSATGVRPKDGRPYFRVSCFEPGVHLIIMPKRDTTLPVDPAYWNHLDHKPLKAICKILWRLHWMIQGLRFDARNWTPERARELLNVRGIRYRDFEPAGETT